MSTPIFSATSARYSAYEGVDTSAVVPKSCIIIEMALGVARTRPG